MENYGKMGTLLPDALYGYLNNLAPAALAWGWAIREFTGIVDRASMGIDSHDLLPDFQKDPILPTRPSFPGEGNPTR